MADRRGASPQRPWTRPALVSALAAVLLHLPVLRYGFVWDDRWLIETNAALRGGAGLGRLLVSDFWAPAGFATGFWRPVVVMSYWFDGRVSNWSPAWFHAVNLAAHAAASAGVAALAIALGAPAGAALAGGLWFAAMPLHVESVAWISGRTDAFCTALFLLALLGDRHARREGRASPGVLPPALLALALLCKETAMVFLPLVAVAEWVERPRDAASSRGRWLAPYAVVTAVWAIAHLGFATTRVTAAGVSPALRWSALTMPPHYLAFLWPWGTHTPAVTLRMPTSALDPDVIVGAIALIAWAVALSLLLRRRSAVAVPVALLGLGLAPVVAVAATAAFVLYAERHFYLASAGAALLLASALAPAMRAPRWRMAAAALAATIVGASAIATWRLLPHWRSDATLFAAMASSGEPNAEAHVSQARILANEGRPAEAFTELATAQAIDQRRPDIFATRGLMFYQRGLWAESVRSIDSALALGARGIEERTTRPLALARLGRLDEARAALEALRAESPASPWVDSAWGQFLLITRRPDEAWPFLERAERYLPGDTDLEFSLGVAGAMTRHLPQAIAALERAVTLSPTHYDAWLMLAAAREEAGDRTGGEQAFDRASALPQARDGRAEALRQQARRRGP
ncbi:MAG: hypothetical protein HYR74_13065 [Candidatus Eisenbacteria bacterium]|nr:hypothetical protein [Candidatus Eisenbacteria bacterium]